MSNLYIPYHQISIYNEILIGENKMKTTTTNSESFCKMMGYSTSDDSRCKYFERKPHTLTTDILDGCWCCVWRG